MREENGHAASLTGQCKRFSAPPGLGAERSAVRGYEARAVSWGVPSAPGQGRGEQQRFAVTHSTRGGESAAVGAALPRSGARPAPGPGRRLRMAMGARRTWRVRPHAVRRRREAGHLRGAGRAGQPRPRRPGHNRRRHRRTAGAGPGALPRGRPRPAGPDRRERAARGHGVEPGAGPAVVPDRAGRQHWGDCRTVAVVNSVQDFWDEEFTRRGGTYSRSPSTGTTCRT